MTQPTTETRWWHLFAAEVPMGKDGAPVLCATMIGDATIGPDDPTLDGRRVQDGVNWPDPDPERGEDVLLVYRGSWDHEPTEEERDAVLPEGYRDEDE